ncbi:MAG: PssD/Cps14F family polysaccharide biosynthesis glycosyltransferase [archaeon]
MKVCLACSAGGHLSEMLQLKPFYGKRGHYFVTFRRPDSESLARNERVFFIERPARNPLLFIVNAFQSLAVLLKENPDLVVSTGADVALATCWWAKLLGKKVIYIESFCRPFVPGVTGKMVEPIADLFIVQWREVQKHYPKSVYGGPIF